MHVGRDRKPPASGRRAAEHCKKVGKEKLIVALCCNATISDNSRSCEHARRLVPLESREQIVERSVSLDRTYLLRLEHVWMKEDSILTG
jgi:hypothetical protein